MTQGRRLFASLARIAVRAVDSVFHNPSWPASKAQPSVPSLVSSKTVQFRPRPARANQNSHDALLA